MLEALFWGVVSVGVPGLLLWAEKRVRAVAWLSPVVACYLVGIALGHLPGVPKNPAFTEAVYTLAICLAIPLLLVGARLRLWARTAGRGLLAFGVAVASALASATLASALFGGNPQAVPVVGMVLAAAVGGAVNLNAVGIGMGADSQTLLVANVADLVWGGLYLVFLLRLAKPVLGRFLPLRRPAVPADNPHQPAGQRMGWRASALALALGLVLMALGAGAAILALLLAGTDPTAPQNATLLFSLLFLGLSLSGLGASAVPRLHRLPGTTTVADYACLVFIVALGTAVDLNRLDGQNLSLILAGGVVVWGAIVLHYFVCWMLRIDLDTAVMASAAAIQSPPLLPPIAQAMNNRHALLTGITTGIVGYAIGTNLALLFIRLMQ